MIAFFSWPSCPKVVKIGTLGEKIMQIPNMSQLALSAIPDYEPLNSTMHTYGFILARKYVP